MQINIGGYDKNVFYERLGINYLEKKLLETFRIVPYFKVNDKTPNLDGWFDLCDKSVKDCQKAIPLLRFSVQIKSLNNDYQNTNIQKNREQQYKYRCDTKVLSTVLTNATYDPIILFLVDWKNEQVFWKHLSFEYCFASLGSHMKETVTLYFSDCDKVDFSTESWIDKLFQIRTKHKTELSNGMDNLFIVSIGDLKVIQQIKHASDTINDLMEGCLHFLKQALFPNTWKFGIAYLKDETGMISAGVYRIVKGMNDEYFKIFDESIDQMILSCRGAKVNVSTVVENYLEWCVSLFFSDNSFDIQLAYMPDLVLNEIAFEELDNKFLYEQHSHQTKTLKSCDKVYLGLQANELSFDEYNNLKEQGYITAKADSCIHQLLQHGCRKLIRPWRKNLTATPGEQQTQKISKEIFLNIEQLDLPDGVTSWNYFTSNEDEVKSDNIQILLKNIQDFYNNSCLMLGGTFYQEIGNCQTYVFDPIEVGSEYNMMNYHNFILPTDETERQTIENNKDQSRFYHNLTLKQINFSWYRIWRILFKNMIVGKIKGTSLPISIEFIISQ